MDKLSSCNKQFLNRINEIKKHIEMTMLQNDLLNDIYYLVKNDEQKEYIHYLKSLNTSTIQYNAIIISLYGCFENYIVDLLSCYTDIMFLPGHYKALVTKVVLLDLVAVNLVRTGSANIQLLPSGLAAETGHRWCGQW